MHLFVKQSRKILTELGDGNYSVCFDATPYRCECFGLGIRFFDQSGKVSLVIASNMSVSFIVSCGLWAMELLIVQD